MQAQQEIKKHAEGVMTKLRQALYEAEYRKDQIFRLQQIFVEGFKLIGLFKKIGGLALALGLAQVASGLAESGFLNSLSSLEFETLFHTEAIISGLVIYISALIADIILAILKQVLVPRDNLFIELGREIAIAEDILQKLERNLHHPPSSSSASSAVLTGEVKFDEP